jgi:type III restriction enzyme
MPTKTIDQLIINSPYEEPREHWKYDRETRLFSRVPGRLSHSDVVAGLQTGSWVALAFPLRHPDPAKAGEESAFLLPPDR